MLPRFAPRRNLKSLRMSATVLASLGQPFPTMTQHLRPSTSTATPREATTSEVPPGYSIDPTAGPMLRFQESLPKLPVPPLSSTLSKYLETVRPHLSHDEYKKTEAAVQDFATSSIGAELQRRLEARRAEPGMKNWLADWWNEAAYMAYRDPVVVFVSYFYVHLEDRLVREPAKRAAQLVKALLQFRALMESKRLEPERVRETPLCMASYKWLFNTCRYPSKPADTAHKFDPFANEHVMFLRKNKFYEVPLFQNGRELSAADLEFLINRIISLAGEQRAEHPLGVLTSENRDTWTDARRHIISSKDNAKALEKIESAIAIICLDDTKPVTREEISWACWTGDGRNRFFDKHQFIVFDNGRSGFLGEHSCMDGTPTLRLNEFMLASLAAGRVDLGPAAVQPGLQSPKELTFELDDITKRYIKRAEKNFDDLVEGHELLVLHYGGYGKNYIKTHRASPDAWAQLVKQLAFQMLKGRPGVCYESCQTRKYQLGRTEVIRSASNESRAWAEAMLNPHETNEHRAQLFRAAVTRHLQYSAWAADGQGVDRHLFGMKRMLKDGEVVPQIYEDPAYARTSHWELSTSQLSSPFLDGWGYGEVVPDGYGLSYSIGDDYIRWTITSRKHHTMALKRCLAEAASMTFKMMEDAVKKASVEKPNSKL